MRKDRERIDDEPTHSIYAFVGLIASYVFLFAYLGWALLPSSVLHKLGITYYPSQYYAIAIPAYGLVTFLLIIVAYIGVNMINTPDPEDLITVRDKNPIVPNAPAAYIKCGVKEGIPAAGDIDPIALSKLLKQSKVVS